MNLKSICSVKKSQTQRLYNSIYMTLLKRQNIRMENRSMGIKGWRKGLQRFPWLKFFRVMELFCMVLGWWRNDFLCLSKPIELLQYAAFKKQTRKSKEGGEWGSKCEMQIETSDSNCMTSVWHNLTIGGGKNKKADLHELYKMMF